MTYNTNKGGGVGGVAPHDPTDDHAVENTDVELYREPTDDIGMEYYQNSIHVTKQGAIGMNVGGLVYVKPIADWHELAVAASADATAELPNPDHDLVEEQIGAILEKYFTGEQYDEIHGTFIRIPFTKQMELATAKLQALITLAIKEATYQELADLNYQIALNDWHKENYYKMFPYISKRMAELENKDK